MKKLIKKKIQIRLRLKKSTDKETRQKIKRNGGNVRRPEDKERDQWTS